jgi:GAF domain-containing protein/ANTAR domain-containing protein
VSAHGGGMVGVRQLIRAEQVQAGDQLGLGGWLQRLCRTAARNLPASGVGVSLMSRNGDAAVVAAASGSESEAIEQLQFTLGEGPCQDAFRLGRPVLTPNLAQAARRTWPGYAPAAQDLGVEAVFAFPLGAGAAGVGVMDVYRAHTGSLTSEAVMVALAFSEAARVALLDAQEQTQDAGNAEPEEGLSGFVVYQAQGMIHVQLGVELNEAMARLRAYAFAHNRSVSEVAADVVARRLVLRGDS